MSWTLFVPHAGPRTDPEPAESEGNAGNFTPAWPAGPSRYSLHGARRNVATMYGRAAGREGDTSVTSMNEASSSVSPAGTPRQAREFERRLFPHAGQRRGPEKFDRGVMVRAGQYGANSLTGNDQGFVQSLGNASDRARSYRSQPYAEFMLPPPAITTPSHVPIVLRLTQELDFVEQQDQTCPMFLGGLPYRDQNVSQVQGEITVVRIPLRRGHIKGQSRSTR